MQGHITEMQWYFSGLQWHITEMQCYFVGGESADFERTNHGIDSNPGRRWRRWNRFQVRSWHDYSYLLSVGNFSLDHSQHCTINIALQVARITFMTYAPHQTNRLTGVAYVPCKHPKLTSQHHHAVIHEHSEQLQNMFQLEDNIFVRRAFPCQLATRALFLCQGRYPGVVPDDRVFLARFVDYDIFR